jgi:adenylate cyclase
MMAFTDDVDGRRTEALRAARDAVRFEERDEYSQWILAAVLGNLFGRLEEALATYNRAKEINPNFSLIYGSMGLTLAHSGHPDESIAQTSRAIQINPGERGIFFRYSSMALAHYLRGEHAEALDWAQRAIVRKTNWWVSYATRIASLWALQRRDDACEVAKTLCHEVPLLRARSLPVRPIAENPVFAEFREALIQAGLPE